MQPRSANNPAFDAFYQGNVIKDGQASQQRLLLQYTVSRNHGVQAQSIRQFLSRLPDAGVVQPVKLVFVVPAIRADLYRDFKWQPWLGAKQQVGFKP
jgi:hypothetical protein